MNRPERIYLVDAEVDEEEDAGPGMAPDFEGVYWCQDQVHPSDTLYIRADLYTALQAKYDALFTSASKHLAKEMKP